MKMTNYDFYDLYTVILCVRAKPDDRNLIPVLKEIVSFIDKPQSGNGIEDNNIRKVIRSCHAEETEYLSFAKTYNVYTAGVRIMKNDTYYRILSKLFNELILSLEEGKERTSLAADCFHNIPLILADEKKPEKRINAEIKDYCKKYNTGFLAEELKILKNHGRFIKNT